MGQTLDVENVLSKRDRQMGIAGLRKKVRWFFIEQKVLLFMIGFLLGRAVILDGISPFAIAFIATTWVSKQNRLFLLYMFTMIGAMTFSLEQTFYIASTTTLFFIQARFLKKRMDMRFLIPLVFFSTVIIRVITYTAQGQLQIYEWIQLLGEGVLGIVLLLIFMQSVPLLSLKRYQPALKSEEVICMIILIASIITGLIGFEISGVSLVHVFSRYVVLILALVGGATVGATVGVVAGLILALVNVIHLYQMCLLAFSGLLGGLLQEGKKYGVGLGLLSGTLFIGMYDEEVTLASTMAASGIAILLFFVTPNHYLKEAAKYIPGTTEYSYEERKYLKKVRDVTAQRVEQYAGVFEALSKSFIQSADKTNEQDEQYETDYFLSLVTETTCQHCFMKERCWQKEFDKTYDLMKDIKNDLVIDDKVNRTHQLAFENHCVKSKKVMETMENEVSILQINKKLKKQVTESKKIVADQLKGVSGVMDNFAKEIVQERIQHEEQELQIIRALKQMNINIEKLDIYHLEQGNIDIEMAVHFYDYHGEAVKLIAPVLSDILNEWMVVTEKEISPFPNGISFLTFGSAQQFEVNTGVAVAAKDGGLISGDAYTLMGLGKGRYALAISDGMGNGIRAREESQETLRLLKQILQTGISEQVAIKSINSILGLRTTDEIFATLDLAIVNLHNANLRCLKIGSSPSFIKRGREIISVEGSNLPIGIIEQVELDSNSMCLKSGDILIMMSDGVFEGSKQIFDHERWLRRKISQLETNDAQEIADVLLEEVIREEMGAIHDDMTIVTAKINRHQPKWASIPLRENAF